MDEYEVELRSGRLTWSPVHKSDKFWYENASKFNEKNFELVKFAIFKWNFLVKIFVLILILKNAHPPGGDVERPARARRRRARHWRVRAPLPARQDVRIFSLLSFFK